MFAYRLYVLVSLILVVAILTSKTERAQSDVFQSRQNRQADVRQEPRQYCGRSLSSTLQMICGGVYNSRFKKSNQEMVMDGYAFINDLHPYKSIENARKMLRFRRNSRGVYEECCLKMCSTEELRSYCGSR
ncbi:PREDICTED: LIRP-like [Dufourea novaeangliae]|uniref:LIRP-like n=1 Tax=Dufourea novaeangliae TaxID=178035 RepID=UPI000766F3FA|nr:PREDICTED: LIRP-like [Dufourea novaeangliae]